MGVRARPVVRRSRRYSERAKSLAASARVSQRAAGSCACTSTEPASLTTITKIWVAHEGGLTSKIHAVVNTNGLPVHLALTPVRGGCTAS
jgi:hypothetical protein